MVSSLLQYAKQYLKHPKEIGFFLPSGRQMAKAMAYYVREENRPKCYLEIGAGAGAATGYIVAKMGPHDSVDLIEINQHFCQQLKEKYSSDPRVRIFCDSAFTWRPEEGKSYDAIISALPLNLLPKEQVTGFLETLLSWSKVGGTCSFVELVSLSALQPILFILPHYRRLLVNARQAKRHCIRQHGIASNMIWRNFPPSKVYHLMRKS